MLAIDDTHDWAQYDEVVRALREGLLAHLDPTVLDRVANALKIGSQFIPWRLGIPLLLEVRRG